MLGLPTHLPSVGKVVVGRQGWILLVDELKYLVYNKPWLSNPGTLEDSPPNTGVDPLSAILYFDRELKQRGINLIVVPVPVRPLVCPEAVISPQHFENYPRVPNLATWQQGFFDHLEMNGCRAVDLTPTFLEHRDSDRGPVFLPTESHWTGYGMVVAGKEIAALVKQQEWYGTSDKRMVDREWMTVDHTGDLSERLARGLQGVEVVPPEIKDVALGPVRMPVRRVTFNDQGRSVAIETRNPDSPVVVVGDSYVAFGAESGYGLGQQLADELGIAVDVLSTNAGGANDARMNLIRAAVADPTYLAGKKCVIWCFASRELVGVKWFPLSFPP